MNVFQSVINGSNVKAKKHFLKSRKTFDNVERKMNHIESSLGSGSTSNLLSRGKVSPGQDPTSVLRLRSQLEQQSTHLKRLQDDLTRLKLSQEFESNSFTELESHIIKCRKQMNKKRDQLKRIQYDGNIDSMISLAEIEFSVEKDQVGMLSLSQRIKDLKIEESKMKRELANQDCLYKIIPENKKIVLVTLSLDRKQTFTGVRMRGEGGGLETINDTVDEMVTPGDRVIEVNGENVLRIQEVRWREMREAALYPAKIVLMKTEETQNPSGNKMTEDIAMIQTRLSEKLREGRHVSQELASVQCERDALSRENTCLVARLRCLEDQVESLQSGMRHVRDSLATCLNTGVLDTLRDTCHAGRDSSSTSGLGSAEDGSDGSSSSQHNSWREHIGASDTRQARPRPSINIEATKTRTETFNMEYSKNDTRPTLAAIRKRLGEETIYENLRQTEIRSTKLDRKNSTVHRVSNLMRWPRNKFKQQERKFL